jgi:hypothetical protein
MTDQVQTGASSPEKGQRGIFLPSMAWTADRKKVEVEKQRLLALQEQLDAWVTAARGSDECATWYVMAEASLAQLDRDIDDLFDWLEDRERRVRKSPPEQARS